MKILAPLSSLDELQELLPLGADEFYFGISEVKHLTELDSLNFRPYNQANFKSIKDAKEASRIIHHSKLKCYLTLNDDICSNNIFNDALNLLEEFSCEIDGIIVTNIALIEEIKDRFPDIDIITSTRCHSFNSWNIKFYKDIGANRFTLPHHLHFEDMIKILDQFPDTKFDIFVKNEGCLYINGICSYFHNLGSPSINLEKVSFCKLMKEYGQFYLKDKNKIPTDILASNVAKKHNYSKCYECKICWMHRLLQFKDRIIVKITGRGHPIENKIRDLVFIKRSLVQLEKADADMENIVSLHKEIYPCECLSRCEIT